MTLFFLPIYYTYGTKEKQRKSGRTESMILYLDIIIILNLLFNLMILSLTKYLARVHTTIYRLLFGTMIATSLVPIVIYFPDSYFNSMLGKGIYSIFIVIAAFGIKSIFHIMKNICIFYFISFSIGGGLFGLHFLVQDTLGNKTNKFLLYVNNLYGDQMSLLIILIGFPIIWFFTKTRMDRHVKDKIKYDQMYNCIFTINEVSHQTVGYIDSGNHLVDPLSNRPVVICDETFLKNFFTDKDWELLCSSIINHDMEQIPTSIQKQISIVPYQGVGGNSDLLFTIRPDKLTVFYENEVIETNDVLIGIQLANLTADNSYHCLLHPQIIHLSTVRSA